MLRGRVVQLLRDALALFLLKIDEALRQLLRLLLQRLALGDIRNDADEPRRLAGIGKLERSVDLQPTPRTALPANSANGVEAAARPHGILQRLLECVGVVRMQIALHELLLAQGPVLVRMPEDLVHALVFPNRAIRLDVPFEDAKRGSARRDPQARFAFPQRYFRAFARGDVEIHAENAVRSNGCMTAEPTLGPIWHAKAKLVLIGFVMLFQALLLGIACLQILEGDTRAQLVGGNDPCIRRQAEQTGLLRVDDGFGAGNVGLECAHLRRLQSEPQSQLALAERGLRFFQVRDVDDRADRAHGPPAMGRVAVVSPPLNGHPSHGPVGPHNAMQAAPFSFIGRVASRFQARGHGRLIARIEQPRRLRISQLRSCGQTQNGAQLGGEASSVALEIAVVNADTADLDCQTQQLIALVWRPNWGSTCAGGFFCGRSRGSGLRELLLRSIRCGGARWAPQSRLDGNSRSCPSPS